MTDPTPAAPVPADAPIPAPAAPTDPTPAPVPADGNVPSDPANPNPDAPKPVDGAPVEYAAFKLPENYTLEGERLDTLKAFAKANNWTQEQAQAAVDKHIEMSEDGLSASREAKVTAWTAQSQTEFGTTFEAVTTDARAGLAWAMKERPNMLKTFDDEGWGSNPDALWVFAKLGALTRGSSMEGLGNDTASNEAKPIAERMFGAKT